MAEGSAVELTRGIRTIFESGSGGKRKITAGNIINTFPGDGHRYRPTPSIGWDEYWVGFNGPDADRLMANGFMLPKDPVLAVGLNDTILHSFTTMLDRVRFQPPAFQQPISAKVLEILGEAIAAQRIGPSGGEYYNLVRRAKCALEQDSGNLLLMRHLAASLNMSVSQFDRLFRKHTGMSPTQWRKGALESDPRH